MNRPVRTFWLVPPLLTLLAYPIVAQQTVFNVPNGDVLERGKAYFELDATYTPTTSASGFTPRVVFGIGHGIEAGLNVNGISTPGLVQTTLTPTIKWRALGGVKHGWAFLLGSNFSIPLQNRSYRAGDYSYAEFTKTFHGQARATVGAYVCTAHLVATRNRAGGQFAIEQPLGTRVTLAADWFTGHHALGFFTPGVIIKITSKLTWYGTYQIGNADVANGNHQLLMEVGWNFN